MNRSVLSDAVVLMPRDQNLVDVVIQADETAPARLQISDHQKDRNGNTHSLDGDKLRGFKQEGVGVNRSNFVVPIKSLGCLLDVASAENVQRPHGRVIDTFKLNEEVLTESLMIRASSVSWVNGLEDFDRVIKPVVRPVFTDDPMLWLELPIHFVGL